MIDVDAAIRKELEQWIEIDARPDWAAVEAAAGMRVHRRRPLLAAALAVAVIAVVAATPLGAAIARGFGGFSNWITGQPGTPASQQAQQRFARTNTQAWLHFPTDTKLRHLITKQAGGSTVTLYGFRAGSSLCLRITVDGVAQGSGMDCAPLADLRRVDAPARVVIADRGFGRGAKTTWYGLDRVHSSKLQITAGVAADGVGSVVVRDNQGTHTVPVTADSFLYVAQDPVVGQRVQRIFAHTARGLTRVPYVPIPFGGLGGGAAPTAPPPTVKVVRPARNGRIGWLDRRETRGESLSVLPARLRRGLLGFRGGGPRTRVVFGRLLTPDPTRPLRVAVTLNANHTGGAVAGICITTVQRDGAGGGCTTYPGVFATSPISFSEFEASGSQQFTDVAGAASDAVTRLRAILANGEWVAVPLADNTFAVELPIAHLPARLVAYDTAGRVIGVSYPVGGFGGGGGPTQAPGKATQLLAVRGPNGAHEELYIGPATGGGECMYVKHWFSKHEAGTMEGCYAPAWRGSPVQLSTDRYPPVFMSGRVRSDVAHVRVVFAGGGAMLLTPTRGFVLAVVPHGKRPTAFVGLSHSGKVLGRQTLPPPPKKR